MNILREVGGELLEMFIADAWLTVGIVTPVSLTGLLMRFSGVQPLIGDAILFPGCIVVLVASIVLAGRQISRSLRKRRGPDAKVRPSGVRSTWLVLSAYLAAELAMT